MSTGGNGTPRRRAYGTGSLRIVGQAWMASWYGDDGRRIQRKIGPARSPGETDGLTKAQAEGELRKIRLAEHDRPARAERVTVEHAGAELSRRLEFRGRKKSHRLTVASDLRNHLVPFFAGKTLDQIKPADVERYVAAKRKTLAVKTIRNHLGTLHSVFETGLRHGWCRSNPVKLAERPVQQTSETRLRLLEPAELEALLAVDYPDDAFGRVERPLYLTAAMTGLRQGELMGLRWRDVDVAARRVRVVSTYVRGSSAIRSRRARAGRCRWPNGWPMRSPNTARARRTRTRRTSCSATPRPGVRSTARS
jgi:integrase